MPLSSVFSLMRRAPEGAHCYLCTLNQKHPVEGIGTLPQLAGALRRVKHADHPLVARKPRTTRTVWGLLENKSSGTNLMRRNVLEQVMGCGGGRLGLARL